MPSCKKNITRKKNKSAQNWGLRERGVWCIYSKIVQLFYKMGGSNRLALCSVKCGSFLRATQMPIRQRPTARISHSPALWLLLNICLTYVSHLANILLTFGPNLAYLAHICHIWLTFVSHLAYLVHIFLTFATFVSHLAYLSYIWHIWRTFVSHLPHLCHIWHIWHTFGIFGSHLSNICLTFGTFASHLSANKELDK